MSRRNRSFASTGMSLRHPKRSKTDNYLDEVISSATTLGLSNDVVISGLLRAIFAGCREHVWWKVLPIDDGFGDIEAATGVLFEYLLPMLMSQRLVNATVSSTVKYYDV